MADQYETVYINPQPDISAMEEVYARKDSVPTKEEFEKLDAYTRQVLGSWQQKIEAESFLEESGKKGWNIEVFKDKEGYYVPYITFAALSKPYQDKNQNETYFKMYRLGKEVYASIDFFTWEIPQVAGLKAYPSYSDDRLIMLRGVLKGDELKYRSTYKLFRVHSEEGGIETIPYFWNRDTEDISLVGNSYDAIFYNNLIHRDDPYFAKEFGKFFVKYCKKMVRKGLIPLYGCALGSGEWFEKKRSWERGSVGAVRKEQDVLDIRHPELVEI